MIKGIKRRERTFDETYVDLSNLSGKKEKTFAGGDLLNSGLNVEGVKDNSKELIKKVLENEF